MAATLRPQDFPVGSKPDWELDAPYSRLKSIPDSYILSTSLHESRTAWMSRLLPKFASRARGKAATDNPIPPPHTTIPLGKCTLEVGPHTISDLAIHEVTYLSSVPEVQTTKPAFIPPPQLQPYGGIASSSSSTPPTTPFSNVTPDLVSHVNSAAQKDPHLAHCIREATAGKASPEEVKYITATINALTASEPKLWRPASPSPESVSNTSQAWDIIFEFKERPNDRWLLPRGPAFIERNPPDSARIDFIHISLLFTAPPTDPMSGEPSSSTPSAKTDVVTLRLLQPAYTLYGALIDWVGGVEENAKNRDALRTTMKRARAQQFLQYQLPVGSDLLAQFRAAAEPPFPMNPVKPDPTAPAKRKRSLATPKKSESLVAPVPSQNEETPSTTPKPKKRRTKSAPTAASVTPKSAYSRVPKPRGGVYVLMPPPPVPMTTQTPRTPVVIACHHCGTTGVPLHMGGRFCRSCINAGHAIAVPGIQHAPVPAPPAIASTSTFTSAATGQAGPSSVPPAPSSFGFSL